MEDDILDNIHTGMKKSFTRMDEKVKIEAVKERLNIEPIEYE